MNREETEQQQTSSNSDPRLRSEEVIIRSLAMLSLTCSGSLSDSITLVIIRKEKWSAPFKLSQVNPILAACRIFIGMNGTNGININYAYVANPRSA